MKKLLSFILGVCLILPCAFLFTGCKDKPETKMETWDGTNIEVSAADSNGVILIETAEELAGLAKEVNEGNDFAGKTIRLTCDMDLANKEWTPIGYGCSSIADVAYSGYRFKGSFDGQNFKIYNLKITTFLDGDVAEGVGLFGHISGATIENVKINTANVIGNHFVGALVGHATGSTINNCSVENVSVVCNFANEDASGDKAGALLGLIQAGYGMNSNLTNCSAYNSTVSADRDAARIAGGAITHSRITDAVTTYSNLNSDETVVVSYNATGAGVGEDTNTNIKNENIARV